MINNEYYDAWSYALNFCRQYDICTDTKKWKPWEKKFFFHIYNSVLKR